MLAANSESPNLMPETNFKEKIRCGEIYRNLNGNEMFQKFYYRCLECSMDFESSTEFEEHMIEHLLEEDEDCEMGGNGNGQKEVIDLSSDDEDDEAFALLHEAVEVTSLAEDDMADVELPLPLMQMLSNAQSNRHSENEDDEEIDDDGSNEDSNVAAFPCEGLRRQALHHYSEPEKCCTECPAYFTSALDLESHVRIHRLQETVACPHCYEVFANTESMSRHIRRKRKKEQPTVEDETNANKKTKPENTTSTTDILTQQNDRHEIDAQQKEIENDGKLGNQNATMTMTTTTIGQNNENNRAENINNIQVDTAKVT